MIPAFDSWGEKWQPTPVFWRIPWTEEPGRPQSMGSQRVRHVERLLMHTHVRESGDTFTEHAGQDVNKS